MFFIALIAFSLLFGCVGEQKADGLSFGPVNGSNFEGKYAKQGDTVQADYTLMLENGTILESSKADIALNAGVYQQGKQYVPLTFQIQEGNGLLPKFTNAFVGMYEGQKKRIVLPPLDAYGEENASKVSPNPRFFTSSRLVSVPISVFVEKKLEAKINTTVSLDFWNATVVDISTSEVLIRHNPVPGSNMRWADIPAVITDVTNETFTYRLDPEVGQIYRIPHPEDSSYLTKIKIAGIEDEIVYVDQNHPLAGKTLIFDLELLKIAGG